MSLTPWNRQEEWYQQMINAATGKYLPSVDAEDAGKVLTVGQDGSWEADAIPQELPTVEETDKDKFLHTNGTTGDLEWASGGGSGGGVLMVGWTFHEGESGEVDGQQYTIAAYYELDKTWQEIYDAAIAILFVVFGKGGDSKMIGVIEKIYGTGKAYKVDLTLDGEKLTFQTSASSGYPRMTAPQP